MNIRLGRTPPNAARAGRREQVDHLTSPARLRTRTGFLPGIDDLSLPSLLGVTGPNMYVSDGAGHYDNLGLMTLLRARCETIWCVDSSPDKFGASKELRRVINLAEDELATAFRWIWTRSSQRNVACIAPLTSLERSTIARDRQAESRSSSSACTRRRHRTSSTTGFRIEPSLTTRPSGASMRPTDEGLPRSRPGQHAPLPRRYDLARVAQVLAELQSHRAAVLRVPFVESAQTEARHSLTS